jgi:hypothetical protein
MEALRIKKRVETDDLSLSGLSSMIGKEVEIIILAESEQSPDSDKPQRVPGSAKGLIKISDDFLNPLPDDEIKEFYK